MPNRFNLNLNNQDIIVKYLLMSASISQRALFVLEINNKDNKSGY